MKSKKKVLLLVLSLFVALTLISCSSKKENKDDLKEEVKVSKDDPNYIDMSREEPMDTVDGFLNSMKLMNQDSLDMFLVEEQRDEIEETDKEIEEDEFAKQYYEALKEISKDLSWELISRDIGEKEALLRVEVNSPNIEEITLDAMQEATINITKEMTPEESNEDGVWELIEDEMIKLLNEKEDVEYKETQLTFSLKLKDDLWLIEDVEGELFGSQVIAEE